MNKEMIKKISLGSFFLFMAVLSTACGNRDRTKVSLGEEAVLEQDSSTNNEDTEINEEESIFVYVTGQVKNPGVYQVKKDARLYVVIEMAGGFKDQASRESLNLAEKVADGQQIKVLSKAEYRELTEDDNTVGVGETVAHPKEGEGNLININTATVEELMSLPGIGQSKADAIINYRDENGSFSTIEEIMKVPGIKEGAFGKIKLLIKV